MGMNNEFLSLKQVKIQIAKQIILPMVDLVIDQGQMVAVVGANGCGKTTFLKLLCGILRPSAGEIRIANCSYSNSQQALKILSMLGYAPDNPPLYPLDTPKSYLEFIATLKKIPRQNRAANIAKVLDLFALNAYRNDYINTLSKGTQQRINLAQAMIHNPQILILDEPTNGLDVDQLQSFVKHLSMLRQQKITIIIASHNYTDLIPLCDYMLKIQQGMITKILLPEPNTKVVNTYDQINYTS